MSGRNATIVADLGFGDAGKGTLVDYLARTSSVSAVIRFNGGGQAAHNVVTNDGRHHTFSQFGSGTFVRGVRTHISRFALIDPFTMNSEAGNLKDLGCGNVFSRFSVDERTLVVTPFHKAANRIREALRGNARHGSCGMGIGETTHDSLIAPDRSVHAKSLRDVEFLTQLLEKIQEVKREEFVGRFDEVRHLPHLTRELSLLEESGICRGIAQNMVRTAQQFPIVGDGYLKRLANEGDLLFEGAQGVLLDEWYGFHPYTTWSTTTFANALAVLDDIGFGGSITRFGVLRGYHTRHGDGPFPTEDVSLNSLINEPHNGTGRWQGAFRLGWFDLVLGRYAIAACGGVDKLAITNMDRLGPVHNRKMCSAYYSDGQLLTQLSVKSELTDLSHQEKLTQLLMKVDPVYVSAAHDDALYIQSIEEELGVPVSIVSYGPTANDKQEFNRLQVAS